MELAVIHGIEPPPLSLTFDTASKRRHVRMDALRSS